MLVRRLLLHRDRAPETSSKLVMQLREVLDRADQRRQKRVNVQRAHIVHMLEHLQHTPLAHKLEEKVRDCP